MTKRVAGLLVLTSVFSVALHGQCVTQEYPNNSAGQLGLMPGTGWDTIGTSVLSAGAAMWAACGQSGSGFPTIQVGGFGVITVTANYVDAPSGGPFCSQMVPNRDSTGRIIGATITVYKSSTQFQDCSVIMASAIAHELGHVLGLNDSACSGYIMGSPLVSRSVQSDECSKVDSLWTTPDESGGGGGGPAGCGQNETPIVINLDNGPYALTGVDDPVSFDLAATGNKETIGWTARAAREAFLWLDRNGNGEVDDGAELFGTATPLLAGGRAPNGFEALAEFDANRDGVIDAQDSVWESLLLWIDIDHDGISQPGEVFSIAETPITAIELAYHWSGRRDQYGNMFRYEGRLHQGKARRPFFDVVFANALTGSMSRWRVIPTCAY
jgi:hypothetical protein